MSQITAITKALTNLNEAQSYFLDTWLLAIINPLDQNRNSLAKNLYDKR